MLILQDIGAYFIMLSKVFRRFTRWSVMKELIIREIDSLIIGSIGIVSFISFFVGGVVAIQTALNLTNPLLPKNLMDIDNGVEKNIKILAEAKNKKISDIQACVLKRPRHDHIVKVLNDLKVKINFITDGDIAGALSVIGDKPKNDIYYSTGGGPEGVIVAAALSCYGGQIQGRLVLDEEEKIRAKKLGITDFNKKYNIDDMVKGDVIFCATGVTSGDLADGVKDLGNEYEVNSFVLHKSENTIKTIKNIYNK